MEHFTVRTLTDGNQFVVAPAGELDIATSGQVREAYEGRAPGQDLTIDLRGLTFMDTSGLQVVVEAYREARDEGFALTIVRGAESIQRIFEISGLTDVLPFTDG